AQMRPQRNSVRLGPKRSPIQPPKTWNSRYGYANAERTNPSCVFESPSSLRISLAAVAMFTRSTYVIRYIMHSSPRTIVVARVIFIGSGFGAPSLCRSVVAEIRVQAPCLQPVGLARDVALGDVLREASEQAAEDPLHVERQRRAAAGRGRFDAVIAD